MNGDLDILNEGWLRIESMKATQILKKETLVHFNARIQISSESNRKTGIFEKIFRVYAITHL